MGGGGVSGRWKEGGRESEWEVEGGRGERE